jgi:hypothetical protein
MCKCCACCKCCCELSNIWDMDNKIRSLVPRVDSFIAESKLLQQDWSETLDYIRENIKQVNGQKVYNIQMTKETLPIKVWIDTDYYYDEKHQSGRCKHFYVYSLENGLVEIKEKDRLI